MGPKSAQEMAAAVSTAEAGLGVAPPSPAPQAPGLGRGVSELAAGRPDVEAGVGKGRRLGRAGPGRWGLGWSKEAPPAPGSSGPAPAFLRR